MVNHLLLWRDPYFQIILGLFMRDATKKQRIDWSCYIMKCAALINCKPPSKLASGKSKDIMVGMWYVIYDRDLIHLLFLRKLL